MGIFTRYTGKALGIISGEGAVFDEEERQAALGTYDSRFLNEGQFVFVLHCPPGMDPPQAKQGTTDGGGTFSAEQKKSSSEQEFIFALPLSPQEYQFGRDFSNNYTPTQKGGVYVEDNGSLMGKIRIAGNFGFKPKMPNDQFGPDNKGMPLSGSVLLQRLERDFFGFYSKVKKDPEFLTFAPYVYMTFHDEKNDRHVEVVPDRVEIKNSLSGIERHVGSYSIEMTIVGEAAGKFQDKAKKKKGWIEGLKDTMRTVNDAITDLQAAINDVKAFQEEIASLVRGMETLITNVENIITSLKSFSELGQKTAWGLPAESVKNTKAEIAVMRDQLAATRPEDKK
ncbi:MAG: hypothetical protein AAB316_23520, partial [Bacteroidota bacterium]